MEYCEAINQKKAEERYFLNNRILECKIENCPYGNQDRLEWESQEFHICKTKGTVDNRGLIKHIESKPGPVLKIVL